MHQSLGGGAPTYSTNQYVILTKNMYINHKNTKAFGGISQYQNNDDWIMLPKGMKVAVYAQSSWAGRVSGLEYYFTPVQKE